MDGFLNKKMQWCYDSCKYFIETDNLYEILKDIRYLINEYLNNKNLDILEKILLLEEICNNFDADYNLSDTNDDPETLINKIVEPQNRIAECFNDSAHLSVLQNENDLCEIIQYCCVYIHALLKKITQNKYCDLSNKKLLKDLLYYVE